MAGRCAVNCACDLCLEWPWTPSPIYVDEPLAPLDPDSFLEWVFIHGDPAMRAGDGPLRLADMFYEARKKRPGLTRCQLHWEYVSMAAHVRRNQRSGVDPFRGVR